MKQFIYFLMVGAIAFLSGCATTYDAQRGDISDESSIVFTRAETYQLFGTRSPWEFFEVTYENFTLDAAGQPIVEVGLRYIGNTGISLWSWTPPPSERNVSLYATCAFYAQPSRQGQILYTTQRLPLLFRLGEITPVKFTAPVKGAASYQIVIGR